MVREPPAVLSEFVQKGAIPEGDQEGSGVCWGCDLRLPAPSAPPGSSVCAGCVLVVPSGALSAAADASGLSA